MEVNGQLYALGCLTEFCDGEFAYKSLLGIFLFASTMAHWNLFIM
jgi:hypothetical protein